MFQRRPFLADMADWEVIERFRLSRARIEWLVEELKEELERNTARSCPLAPETQVNIIVVVVVFLRFEGVCMEALYNCEVLFYCFSKPTNGGEKKLINT